MTFVSKKTTKESELTEGVMAVQLTIRMPDEYKGKIEGLAKRMGLKKSDVARLALKQFIEENVGNDRKVPYARVKHLVGSVQSGIKDLGQHHRKYLIQSIRKGS
ncbi:MAG: CopG family transcriptional regulator [Deltaproteobacteria bacterium]|nr:CopG family transcriptional regulator [Deltaproteobacteria bacterium]MBW1920308.1 CopG family transcriptional regulator [Deltaproteobacteria bacterium]MBW1936202.1 CopG family transcriptional regulator [Deltaproteobacteria bacterium]MBW1979426.1 CopG family transcriptional regulator [Deltaproteobacteria bacterium]MBW2046237.1 CopG family transcriptional regulator [Deltaproteobacteria bacterium]